MQGCRTVLSKTEDGRIEIAENPYLKQIKHERLRAGIEGFEHGEYQVVEALQAITLYRAQSFDTSGGSYFYYKIMGEFRLSL